MILSGTSYCCSNGPFRSSSGSNSYAYYENSRGCGYFFLVCSYYYYIAWSNEDDQEQDSSSKSVCICHENDGGRPLICSLRYKIVIT